MSIRGPFANTHGAFASIRGSFSSTRGTFSSARGAPTSNRGVPANTRGTSASARETFIPPHAPPPPRGSPSVLSADLSPPPRRAVLSATLDAGSQFAAMRSAAGCPASRSEQRRSAHQRAVGTAQYEIPHVGPSSNSAGRDAAHAPENNCRIFRDFSRPRTVTA